MAKQSGAQQWHANYWKDEKHGKAWDRVSQALKRDWEQTRNDVNAGGTDLNQGVGDTVKQAVGKEMIPGASQANPPKPGEAKSKANWKEAQPAMQYGFGARQEYGTEFNSWDEPLEKKLSAEWDTEKTGRRFEDVKPWVRTGWDAKS